MSVIYSEVNGEESTSDSFWMPNNYTSTVKRTEDGFRLCDEIIACFQDRAKIEQQYALQMDAWTRKWKPLVDNSPMYGSLLRAWQAFMTSTEKLSALHVQIHKTLMTDDTDRIRNWQKDNYHRKIFGGFKESCELESGFHKAQKPWTKKLKKLEKAKASYHKACKKEHLASVRENNGKVNPEFSLEKQQKLTEERQKCKLEMDKVKLRYEKTLQELNKYNGKYIEEMETVFDQSQHLEQKKIFFLKQTLQSLHKHLDVTNNESIMTVYGDLNQAIMAVSDLEDLKWWRNKHGPGMLMNWPQLEEWHPDIEQQLVRKKKVKEDSVKLYSVTPTDTSFLQLLHICVALSQPTCAIFRRTAYFDSKVDWRGENLQRGSKMIGCSGKMLSNAIKWRANPERRRRKQKTTIKMDGRITRMAKAQPMISDSLELPHEEASSPCTRGPCASRV